MDALRIEHIYNEWQSCIRLLYITLKTERIAELEGKRWKGFDQQGIHPVSYLIGQIHTFQALCPEIRNLGFNHLEFVRTARDDATQEYLNEKLAELRADKEKHGSESQKVRSKDIA
jgi:hypothetical protein